MNVKDLDSKSAGDVINLLSADANRIEFGLIYMPFIFATPIQLIIVISILLSEVGPTFIAGLIVIFLTYPIKALITRCMDSIR